MELFYRKQEGNEDCLRTERFSISHLKPSETTLTIHIHDFFEIYYSIAGGKEFFISDNYYEIHPNDIFFIRPNENHHVTQLENIKHERINIAIHPRFIQQYSTPETSLDDCFLNPKYRSIHLSNDSQKQLDYLIRKIAGGKGYGSDILENICLCEILIMLRRCQSLSEKESIHSISKVDSGDVIAQAILQYINEHLSQEISLELLSKEFFISQSYLCRLFKRYTGITINKYISARRISLAVSLINSGQRPSDVYGIVGFKNYNNFFKTFVDIMGVSPKNYMKYN